MQFETKTVATGERLASLMFQLQMTGYMFKNAEYRSSMSSSLGSGGLSDGGGRMLLGGSSDGDAKAYREGKGRLKGKIKVKYGGAKSSEDDAANDDTNNNEQRLVKGDRKTVNPKQTSTFSTPGMEVEVDAQAYMSELRGEVSRLRDELDATKQAKEEEIRKDLL